MDDRDLPILEESIGQIWEKARELGLDPYPTHFEIVPAAILYEFGAYRLPGIFSDWTHGKADSSSSGRSCKRNFSITHVSSTGHATPASKVNFLMGYSGPLMRASYAMK